MTVKKTKNTERRSEIEEAIRANDGYCCCAIVKNQDTKCMCKDFREKIANGYIGECHCGLYISSED